MKKYFSPLSLRCVRAAFIVSQVLLMQVAISPSAVAEDAPVWTLQPLSTDSRYESLHEILATQEFVLDTKDNVYTPDQTQLCSAALANAVNANRDDILDPTSRPASTLEIDRAPEFKNCKDNNPPYKQYYPNRADWDDASNPYGLHLVATKNMEVYDLALITGTSHRVFLSEGGQFVCKEASQKDCASMMGYTPIAKIIESDSCVTHQLPINNRITTISGRDTNGALKANQHFNRNWVSLVRSEQGVDYVSYKSGFMPSSSCLMKDECESLPAHLTIVPLSKEIFNSKQITNCNFIQSKM